MNVIIWVVRALFVLISVGAGYSVVHTLWSAYESRPGGVKEVYCFLFVNLYEKVRETAGSQTVYGFEKNTLAPHLVAGIFFIIALIVIIVDMAFSKKNLSTFSAVIFGLIVGIAISMMVGPVLTLAVGEHSPSLEAALKLPLAAVISYLCISIILQTKDDFRFIIPYIEFSKEQRGMLPVILDTSAIIDGRFADLAEAKIIDSPIIIPRFVLQEIHGLSDSPVRVKRTRGRRGLDILNRLQKNDKLSVQIDETKLDNIDGVDNKLVQLAKDLNGKLVTTDFNLNKLAQLQKVDAININDIANALKTVALPGEHVNVRIIKPGEEVNQGVGYLDDGTMIVVEQGRGYIGREVTILVTSTLQTSAGRMIFGRIEENAPSPGNPRPGNPRRSSQA